MTDDIVVIHGTEVFFDGWCYMCPARSDWPLCQEGCDDFKQLMLSEFDIKRMFEALQ